MPGQPHPDTAQRQTESEIVRALVHLAARPSPVADRLADVLDRRTTT
ncbi:hypothetical protein ABZZ74_44525 [Streptomyces sp. NPDC006476]